MRDRVKSYHFGLKAEQAARWWLKLKGYKILAERYRNAFGEIDIIAERKGVLALVEVKARQSFRDCLEAITPAQQQRIIRAANSLLAYPGAVASHLNLSEMIIRFDVIMIVPGHFPRHITDAWRT